MGGIDMNNIRDNIDIPNVNEANLRKVSQRINVGKFLSFLAGVVMFSNVASASKDLVNFSSVDGPGFWYPLTDQIRGGSSTAFMTVLPDQTAEISGTLSLISGAGFSSYRVNPEKIKAWDISGANDMKIELSGDQRVYKLLLKDAVAAASKQDYSWQVSLPTTPDMRVLQVPIASFKPYFRGKEMTGLAPLDRNQIVEMGIQLNDKVPGPFSMRLKSISVD
jgi:hypothetical protein